MNNVSAFYQTLVAATTEASQVLAPTWNAAASVYRDFRPDAATIGQTIDVPIPVDPTNSVADAGVGDLPLTDFAFTNTAIAFDKHPEFGYIVRDFEQFNSALAIRTVFLDAALKAVMNHINNRITALFVTGNFTTNTAVSTTGGLITTTQFLQAQALLLDQKVPALNNPGEMSLILGSVPYTKLEDNASWATQQVAGARVTEQVRETSVFPSAFGMSIKADQQMPVTGAVGSRTFTAAYLHKWAVALATRPLPQPDPKVVEFTYVDFAGIPIRVMLGYNQLKGGWVVTIDAGYGLKVVRENMCVLFSIAE